LNAHASHGPTAMGGAGPAPQADRLKSSAAQVAIVVIQNFIVAHDDIGPPITIQVEDHHTQTFPARLDAGTLGDVTEGSIPVIPEQVATEAGEVMRPAGGPNRPIRSGLHAVRILVRVEVQVAANEQVEVAIAVNVAERATRAPSLQDDARLGGHVPEAASRAVRLIA